MAELSASHGSEQRPNPAKACRKKRIADQPWDMAEVEKRIRQLRGAQHQQDDEEARQDVLDYIEMFYNPKRKHARNGMLSPVEFERQRAMTHEGV